MQEPMYAAGGARFLQLTLARWQHSTAPATACCARVLQACDTNIMIACGNPHNHIRGSIVVSISACHAEDPGSIPGRGDEPEEHFLVICQVKHLQQQMRDPCRWVWQNIAAWRDPGVGWPWACSGTWEGLETFRSFNGPEATSATGTRARVARVRAKYPNQVDYSGICIH